MENKPQFSFIADEDVQVTEPTEKVEVGEQGVESLKASETPSFDFIPVDRVQEEIDQAEKDINAVPNAIETFAAAATSKVTFKLADKLIGGPEHEALLKKAKDKHFFAGLAGDIVGFALNPLGAKAGAVAKGTKLLSGPILNAAAQVLAVESVEGLVDVVDAGIKNPSGFTEALKSEGIELGVEVGGALVGGTLATGAVAPIRAGAKATKGLVREWSKLAKKWVGEDAAKIIDNSAEIIANEGGEGLSRKVALTFDKVKAATKEVVDKALKEGNDQVVTAGNNISKQVDEHLVSLIEGIKKPEKALNALVQFSDDIAVAGDALSAKYGQNLDELAIATKGKKVNIKAIKEEVLKVFELEGTITKAKGKVQAIGKSEYQAALSKLQSIVKKDEISHAELGQLVRVFGRAKIMNGKSDAHSQAFKVFGQLRKELVNPETWGEEAALMSEDMLSEYISGKTAFNAIKSGLTSAKTGIRTLQQDPDSYLSVADDIYKGLQKADINSAKLAGTKSLNGVVPVNVQNRIKSSLVESKKLIDFKNATDLKSARGQLKRAFSGKFDANKDADALKDAILKYSKRDELFDALGAQHKAIPQISKVLQNPTSRASIETAKKYSSKYANQVSPELQRMVNSLGKWSRLSGAPKGNEAKQLKALKEFAEPAELMEIELLQEFVPEVKSVIKAMDLENLVKKRAPSILKYIPGLNGSTGDALVGIASLLTGNPAGAALWTLKNMVADPTALRLFVERNASKSLSTKQIQAVLQGGKIASLLSEELKGDE